MHTLKDKSRCAINVHSNKCKVVEILWKRRVDSVNAGNGGGDLLEGRFVRSSVFPRPTATEKEYLPRHPAHRPHLIPHLPKCHKITPSPPSPVPWLAPERLFAPSQGPKRGSPASRSRCLWDISDINYPMARKYPRKDICQEISQLPFDIPVAAMTSKRVGQLLSVSGVTKPIGETAGLVST